METVGYSTATIVAIIVTLLTQSFLIAALLISNQKRKRIGAALSQSEKRYRQVIDSQRELVCRYRPDGVLTFVNDAYCRYFERSREELLGLDFHKLIPAEDHPVIDQLIGALLDTKEKITHEHPVICRDGGICWMQWEDYPVLDENGNITEIQGIGRDITRRWKAIEFLRQSEERFAGIFRGSPIAISIIRQADGKLLEVNPSWENFFEVERSVALESSPVELGLIQNPELDHGFKKFIASGKSLRGFEQRVRTFTGKKRWMSVSCELVPLNNEPCYIVMSKDITDQKEVEEARHSLIHTTKLAMLGELTASIAHEVNQPLSAILSNADTAEMLLKSDAPPLSEISQILADIRRDDLRASGIIKRIRSMITPQQVQMTPLHINEVIKDVEDLVSHDIQKHGVKIMHELAPDLPDFFGDRIQMEQVILNLLLNAIDALKHTVVAERWIVIRSNRGDDYAIEASVEDSGPGIDQESLAKIFDSFFTTKSTGMGLGLALSRSIVEAHGGHLVAENMPHGGASMRITLPIHRTP